MDNCGHFVHVQFIEGKLCTKADSLCGISLIMEFTGEFIPDLTTAIEIRGNVVYIHCADDLSRIFFPKDIKSEQL